VWIGAAAEPTSDPDVQRADLTVAEASFDVPVDEATKLWSAAPARAA
jgi:hypothetical protein